MAWVIPIASASNTTQIADGDDLYVAKPILLDLTELLGSNHRVKVDGTIASSDDALFFTNEAGTGNTAVIYKDAVVRGFQDVGVLFFSSNSVLDNRGTIFGGVAGVGFGSNSPTATSGTAAFANSGDISSDTTGVVRNISGETIALFNTGTISGKAASYGTALGRQFTGVDQITNNGLMDGAINLQGGNDTYDGRKGHVVGVVSGGDGLDKLYGGTEANTLSGGAGNDTLIGGRGNDAFLFDTALSATANVDRIIDFANASDDNDRVELDNAVFTKVKDGALLTAYFKDLGVSGAKVDSTDRVLYNSKTGDLSYDSDGSGSAKAVRFAHLDTHPVLTAADFMVV